MITVGNFRIRRYDEHNIVVEEFRGGGQIVVGKMSKDRWKICGYWGRLEPILSFLIAKGVDEADTLKELSNKIEWIKAEIENTVDVEKIGA
jgi:hypothetical protein